jgi:hypothetical protein
VTRGAGQLDIGFLQLRQVLGKSIVRVRMAGPAHVRFPLRRVFARQS